MTIKTLKCKWNKTIKECVKIKGQKPCKGDCELQYLVKGA